MAANDPLSQTLTMPDGRTVGFADFGGPPDAIAVIDCHGGPGNRFAPKAAVADPEAAGFRLIGIDRPGYGLSTPLPERSIADWVPDALAVADALGIDRFVAVGSSTGASYSLALAAMVPERVIAAMAVCGMTDMRWAEGKHMVTKDGGQFAEVWATSTREETIEVARQWWGDDGTAMAARAPDPAAPPLAPADLAMFADPAYLMEMIENLKHSFAFGVEGYTDDRRADGVGWGSFDVAQIRCPVVVLHGEADSIAPVAFAHHTASIVPGAKLVVVPELGHFSIGRQVVPELVALMKLVGEP